MITNTRNFTMNKFLSLIGTYALLLSVFAVPVQAKVIEKVTKTFEVNSNSQFFINNINGSIEIKQWTKNEIGIEASKEADSQNDLDNMKVKMSHSSNKVTVETEYIEQNSHHYGSGSVDFIISLPIEMADTHVELVNGSLAISTLSGDLAAQLVNGSIKVNQLAGNAKLQSVNGSIKATYYKLDDNVQDIDISTVNGSVKLNLPKSINAKVEAETMHGSLKSDFGLSIDKSMFTGKTMEGQMGSGDIQIAIESVNGSIKVLAKD